MTTISILEAVNTTAVQFHGQPIITAMVAGVAYVAMRPIVENIGIDWTGQSVKLRNQKEKFNCRDISMVAADGKLRKLLCLPLRKLNGWLFSINPERVRADIKDKLIQYQEECFAVLHEYWTKGEVKPKAKTRHSTATQLTPLRQTAERLITTGLGRLYPDIWKLVHQRFDIEHIHQLLPEQIGEAIEYLNVLEGEFLGKQEALSSPTAKQFTDEELCKLCWLWNYCRNMAEYMLDIEPLLRAAEHRLAGAYYSMPRESTRTLNAARRMLQRETMHIECNHWTDDNWRVLNKMRIDHPDFR
ncbi:phage antirepressor N-terminal domain-containing protein [Serratia fonticola]